MIKKVVIIGAGHNSLVTACCLAKAGYDVKVFEKKDVVGGCCVTDEKTFPGFKISSAAYVNSLFLPEIVNYLNLKKYGYEILFRNPSSFTPLMDGRYLFLGPDMDSNVFQIGKFSKKDAENYPKYERALEEIAKFMDNILRMSPSWAGATKELLKLNFVSLARLSQLVFTKADRFLDSWFESDVLKATLLTDALIGATDVSGYVLLHHVMGEAGNARGVWGYQKGGMGGLSNALSLAAKDIGVKIYTDVSVKSITTNNKIATGVLLESGEFVPADIVVSGVDPKLTFLKLLQQNNEIDNFKNRIKKLDFKSASMKINLALSGLPNFKCLPMTGQGPQHRGTIHLASSVDYILKALREGNAGIPSQEPILELTIPSVIDETIAPKGKHIMNIFLQFAPYNLKNGSWDEIKERYFEKNVMPILEKYISNMREIIEGVQIISPLDLERDFSLTEGNIFHGAMTLPQLFMFRPVLGYANYRTPIKDLYLCGSGAHPGGGVTGACGFNAAREIILDNLSSF